MRFACLSQSVVDMDGIAATWRETRIGVAVPLGGGMVSELWMNDAHIGGGGDFEMGSREQCIFLSLETCCDPVTFKI